MTKAKRGLFGRIAARTAKLRAGLTEQVIGPLVRRVGTAVSAYLVGIGVPTDQATAIVTGLVTAVLVGVDLVLSYVKRKGL